MKDPSKPFTLAKPYPTNGTGLALNPAYGYKLDELHKESTEIAGGHCGDGGIEEQSGHSATPRASFGLEPLGR